VWRSRFDAHPDIVGQVVRLGNVAHTVVGVMPRGFLFPVSHDYWVPLRTDVSRFARGQGPAVFIFGRLADGATMADANAELTAVGQRSAALYPDTHRDLRPQVLPYAYPILDIQDTSLWQVAVMQTTLSLLLVIVAVNVAILIYARTATRQGEIAVRTALGASRSRIIAQLFIEAFVLALTAAVLGLAMAKFGLDQAHELISFEMLRPPYWVDYGLPWIAVPYVIALALLTAIVAGVVPALQATSGRVQSTLRELSGSTSLRLGRTWTTLIVAQVALTVAAMPLAFGMGWHEVRSNATRPAFAVEQFLAAAFAMDPEAPEGVDATAYRRSLNANATRVQTDLLTRLEREPWVDDVTIASRPPGQEGSARVQVEGLDGISAAGHAVAVNSVDVDFFDAMQARMLAGRRFTTADQHRSAPPGTVEQTVGVVIVNRAFAHYVLGDDDVIGRRIRYPAQIDEDDRRTIEASPWYEVVGVVSDLHANAVNPELVRPLVYHPLAPASASAGSVIVRIAGGTPASYAPRLRELTAAIDPSVRLRVYPLVDIYRQANVAMRLLSIALALALASVLLLSAAGVYALMSFAVAQRRREIGIRAALGADARRLLWSVFARATRQLAFGVLVGVALALGADAASNGEFMGTIAPVLVGSMAALITIVGLLAAFGPARRGLRLHPTQALREE
jgi:predicted permease